MAELGPMSGNVIPVPVQGALHSCLQPDFRKILLFTKDIELYA